MGRYVCHKGKAVNMAKANKVCLIRRCPYLIVRQRIKGIRYVVPITMTDNLGGCNE